MRNKRRALLFAVFLFMAVSGDLWSQAPPTVAAKPTRAETEILKSVVLITVEANDPKDGRLVPIRGTGFLVAITDPRLTNYLFVYLVTNRHVAEAIEQDERGNCKPWRVKKTYVTMNLKEPVNGNRADQEQLTFSRQSHWYFPTDEAIDLAVMPIVVNAKYELRVTFLDQFLTADILEKRQVVPGDRVLTGGYFYLYAESQDFQPILREGVLAMLPNEQITTTTCKPGKVYFADVHVIPGNSGSPMFVIPALPMNTGVSFGGAHNTFGLLGVVSGYMQETEGLTLKASSSWKASIHSNSGISVIVPAQQLKDLLESSELKRMRDEAVERAIRSRR